MLTEQSVPTSAPDAAGADPVAFLEAQSAPVAAPADKIALLGYPQVAMRQLMVTHGLPAFRGSQVFAALFARRLNSFAAMTELSQALRQQLAACFELQQPQIVRRQIASDGTRKYLLAGADGGTFEAVYIPHVGGSRTNTLCISSQTGCAVGCKFCFTASLRRNRNLSSAEIVGQVRAVQDDLQALGATEQVTNLVYMGMGEPLLNFQPVIQATRIFLDPLGMAFSSRRVTLSTSGIVPRLYELAALYPDLPLQLAISLNATTDAVRTQIMPINKKWPLAQLLQALRDFPLAPRRRFTIEYVLLGGINDSLEDAHRLAQMLAQLPVKINLLPLNAHDKTPFQPPAAAQVRRFQTVLHQHGLHALLRTPRGQDISAACGQLGGATAPAGAA